MAPRRPATPRSSRIPAPPSPEPATGILGSNGGTFTVEGDPVPKARPRFVRGHTMTDPRTTRGEQSVVMAARRARVRPLDGPVIVWLAYWRRTRVHCDIDNLVKLTLDALNGIAWQDDHQVVELHVTKRVDPDRPRTEVRLACGAPVVEPVADWHAAWEPSSTGSE